MSLIGMMLLPGKCLAGLRLQLFERGRYDDGRLVTYCAGTASRVPTGRLTRD